MSPANPRPNPLGIPSPQKRAAACERCGRPIVFVRNVLSKAETWIPVDPVPDPEGNVCAFRDQQGRRWSGLHGWPISAEHPHDPRGRIYMPHPAICPVRPGPAGGEQPRRKDPELPLEFPEYEDEYDDGDYTESEEMPQEYTQ